jgi:small nuclear ribonucleoprotein (snRNP)-like protein
MKKIAIGLIVAMLTATNVFGQEAQTWRKVAEAIPLGTKVEIQTLDGRKVKGTLMRVDETSVLVKKNSRIPEAPVQVTFEQTASIEKSGGGMSWGKAIGIGVATGASAILTIFVIALQLD